MSRWPRSIGNGTSSISRSPSSAARSRSNQTWLPLYRTRARWTLERAHATASDRALALADLDRAIQLGVPNSREQAKDFAEKGRVLLLDKQFQQALDACDAALRIDPKDGEVHRYRVGALLELKRDHDAIVACDAALRTGPSIG